MSPRVLLTLDLATTMGWSAGPVGEIPRTGALRLAPPGASPGEVGRGFLRWFSDFRKLEPECRDCWFEAPFDPRHMGAKTNASTARILIGLAFAAEMLAEASGMRVVEAHVNEVRKHILGHGRWKKDEAKPLIQAAMVERGIAFSDDNAADAAAIHVYASAVLLKQTVRA